MTGSLAISVALFRFKLGTQEIGEVDLIPDLPRCNVDSEAIDALTFDRALGQVPTRLNQFSEMREARVASQTFLITKIDLLHDPAIFSNP